MGAAALVARSLADVERFDSVVRAFVHVADGRALADATRRDSQEPGCQGPATFTFAVKDNVDVAGMPTRAGTRVMNERMASASAPVVAHVEAAGGICIGKTNLPEFALGASSPPTANPRDTSRTPGGSSGGSAAAVAAGFVDVAVGTDTGGSVRVPASFCGVWGMRLRSHTERFVHAVPTSPSYDAFGILGRSLEALTRALPRSLSVPSSPGGGDRRFAILWDEGAAGTLDEDVAWALERVRGWSGAGAVDGVPALSAWLAPRMTVQMSEVLAEHRRAGLWPGRQQLYSDEVRRAMRLAEHRSEEEVASARAELRALQLQVRRALLRHGTVVSPTVPYVAPKLDAAVMSEPGDHGRSKLVETVTRFTLPFSEPWIATLSIPVQRRPGSMPVGIQVAGLSEHDVLGAAAELQAGLPGLVVREPAMGLGAAAP